MIAARRRPILLALILLAFVFQLGQLLGETPPVTSVGS